MERIGTFILQQKQAVQNLVQNLTNKLVQIQIDSFSQRFNSSQHSLHQSMHRECEQHCKRCNKLRKKKENRIYEFGCGNIKIDRQSKQLWQLLFYLWLCNPALSDAKYFDFFGQYRRYCTTYKLALCIKYHILKKVWQAGV